MIITLGPPHSSLQKQNLANVNEDKSKRTREEPYIPCFILALPPVLGRRLDLCNPVSFSERYLIVLRRIITVQVVLRVADGMRSEQTRTRITRER